MDDMTRWQHEILILKYRADQPGDHLSDPPRLFFKIGPMPEESMQMM